jgi:hypothetical protein
MTRPWHLELELPRQRSLALVRNAVHPTRVFAASLPARLD